MSAARQDLGWRGRQVVVAAVLGVHALLAWRLVQAVASPPAAAAPAPIEVHWIAPPLPAPAPPTPTPVPQPRPQPTSRPAPQPVIATTAPQAPTAVAALPADVPVAAVAPASTPGVVAAAPAAAPPPAPAAPAQIPATALRYLVPPAQAYPLASRRLKEQGTVLLRLLVDAAGLPQQVTLHRSSGFPRLDEQALQAMRAARFQPHTQNGVAVAWTAIAPLAYELD